MTSDEVIPKCSQRADGPTCSATAVVKAITSCWVVRSMSSIRAMSNPPRSRMSRAAAGGTMPASAIASAAAVSTRSHSLVAALVAPDAAHLRVGVSRNHRSLGLELCVVCILCISCVLVSCVLCVPCVAGGVWLSSNPSIHQSIINRSGGISSPLTLPSTVAESEPFLKRSSATRCTSAAVTRSTPCSVSSSPNCRSK